ncbi:uncharacterized protein BDV17DRAFT_254698 [Aspergillus undulatus]|uniref:uncharacterized protein n=1 Tax=Aspergillus undulatus TaxID=1810928 RepID=UPI003CCCF01C
MSRNDILSQRLASDESKQFKGALTSLILKLFFLICGRVTAHCALLSRVWIKSRMALIPGLSKVFKVNSTRLSECTALKLPYSFLLLIARIWAVTAPPAVLFCGPG